MSLGKVVVAVAAVLSAAAVVAATAPGDPVLRLVEEGLRSNGAYATLSGSENLTKAIAWTAEQMKHDGLDRVWTEPVMVPHWVRGEGGGRIVAPVSHPLVAPLAGIAADELVAGGGGADISPMADAGVPQFGLRTDGTHYFDIHHTMADTLDKVDPHELAMDATAMAVMAWQLANLDPPIPRYVPPKKEDENKPPGIRR